MTIEEIQRKRRATENDIYKLLVDFSDTTGLVVEGVNFSTVDTATVGGERRITYTAVKMDVRLG